MSKEANLAAQEKFGEAMNAGDLETAMLGFAVDAVDHDPAPNQGPGREGFTSFFTELAQAFPDAHIEPQMVMADDENVAIAYTLTGTHQGDFQGIAATGKSIEVRGMQIGRYVDAQIVERWGSTDQLGIMSQLGATPKQSLKDKLRI